MYDYLGNKKLQNLHKTAFQSKATAFARNKYICDLADKIFFVGVAEQSSLFPLAKEFSDKAITST